MGILQRKIGGGKFILVLVAIAAAIFLITIIGGGDETGQTPQQIVRDLVDASRSTHIGTEYENIEGYSLILRTFPNPKGEGTIVADKGGFWVWLVSGDGTVYALNGATKTLTPSIEYSSEHPSEVKFSDVQSLIK